MKWDKIQHYFEGLEEQSAMPVFEVVNELAQLRG